MPRGGCQGERRKEQASLRAWGHKLRRGSTKAREAGAPLETLVRLSLAEQSWAPFGSVKSTEAREGRKPYRMESSGASADVSGVDWGALKFQRTPCPYADEQEMRQGMR